MIGKIKHMAFAVRDVDAALAAYKRILGVDASVQPRVLEKARSREAKFVLGDTEFQICQSLEPGGRFDSHIQKHGEGLHHMCFTVDDINEAVQRAQENGATLLECRSCKVVGPHAHPEGHVAFLADGAVPGLSVEYMQEYGPDEMPAEGRKDV